MEALARVEIDLGALARNYAVLAAAADPGFCSAVVKANAYGLGVDRIARTLAAAGCQHFFVATPLEGVELRAVLPESEILVLDGPKGCSIDEMLAAQLQPVLNTQADIEFWDDAGPAGIHLDTGMNRLGLTAGDIAWLRRESARVSRLDVRYVLTHLACADEPDHPLNRAQLDRFNELRSLWPMARTSIGNAAGLLLGDEFRSDLARPGIALYGCNPFIREPSPVEPVVTVKANVLQIKDLDAGAEVGYGASFVAATQMRVATVGLGYADGYLRSLSNCGIADLGGQRVPVVGRVSMDLVCLDVSDCSRDAVKVGDWATMIGGRVSLEEVAATAGTIGYELLTSLGPRLERIYLDEGM